MPRTYDMTRRSQSAAQTADRIAAATEELISRRPLGEVTLQDIADRAGVTVQTVLRHMGSREGCFEAVAQRVGERVRQQRDSSRPGDVDAAIRDLVAHYEAEGRLVLRLLCQEKGDDPIAAQAVQAGREYHRAWVERSLAQDLDQATTTTIDALVAATDIYVWKLLRLDIGRSVEGAGAVIATLVRAVLEES